MLSQLGITVPRRSATVENVAAVMVTRRRIRLCATGTNDRCRRFPQWGTLKVCVAGRCDAVKSWMVYALTRGNILVGGAGASAGGSSVQVNQQWRTHH